MIRTKPPSDEYRDGRDRVFGGGDGYSGTPDDRVLHYRLESSEDATEQMAKAEHENREQTMEFIRELLGG